MKNTGTILITGGLGYIGSHIVVLLLQQGYNIVIVDSLSDSYITTLYDIQQLIGKKVKFYQVDLKDKRGLERVFKNHPEIDTVIHLVGKKNVEDSCKMPFSYYENNIQTSLNLYRLMFKYKVHNIIYSSSSTVYDTKKDIPPFYEKDRTDSVNPYGTTNLSNEYILKDLASYKEFNVVILRYFNVIGAHESGFLGENPRGTPNNLLSYILKVAKGEIEELEIFGNKYNTEDGTGVRDYIHVEDLAQAHIDAYIYMKKKLARNEEKNIDTFNVGSGEGISVMQMINMTEQIVRKKIKHHIFGPRKGDLPIIIANPQKTRQILGWKPQKTICQAISSSRNFIQKNYEK